MLLDVSSLEVARQKSADLDKEFLTNGYNIPALGVVTVESRAQTSAASPWRPASSSTGFPRVTAEEPSRPSTGSR